MAGGMGGGRGPNLAARSGLPPVQPSPDAASRADRVRPVVLRHCWVQGVPDTPGRWPGLLVEWRQPRPGDGTRPRWEGRVVYVVSVGPTEAVVVETWVDAAHLSPA